MNSTDHPTPTVRRNRRYWRKHHYLLFDAPGSEHLAGLLAASARVWPHLTDQQIIERVAWEFVPFDDPRD